jgi:hypothetical protein
MFVGLLAVALVIALLFLAVWWIGAPTQNPALRQISSQPVTANAIGEQPKPKTKSLSAALSSHPTRSNSVGEQVATPRAIVIPPCAQGQPVERLATGERIENDGSEQGESKLLVTNGTGHDAAIRLADFQTGRSARFVYIQDGDSYRLSAIAPGSYRLSFATGFDWVPNCVDFVRDESYSEFEKELVFRYSTTEDEEAISTWVTNGEVTLNPVVGGNAKIRKIDRKRFLEGDQYMRLGP